MYLVDFSLKGRPVGSYHGSRDTALLLIFLHIRLHYGFCVIVVFIGYKRPKTRRVAEAGNKALGINAVLIGSAAAVGKLGLKEALKLRHRKLQKLECIKHLAESVGIHTLIYKRDKLIYADCYLALKETAHHIKPRKCGI